MAQARRKPPAATPASRAVGESRPWSQRLRAWRRAHAFALFSSLGRLVVRPVAMAMTIGVVAIAWALPTALFLTLENAERVRGSLREALDVAVFLHADSGPEPIQALSQTLAARPEVAGIELQTPEQGLEEFRAHSGFADALEALEHNPLPPVLIVRLHEAAGAAALVASIEGDPRVDFVQHDARWQARLQASLDLVRRAVWVLALVLGLGVLLIVGNTIRLDLAGRAEEIAVMKLLGASDGFVRRPFLYSGAWYGLLGGLLAATVVEAAAWALQGPAGALAEAYAHKFTVRGLSASTALGLIGVSGLIGWLGAWIVADRHLAATGPD